MAIYSCQLKTISRAKGQTSVASAAYRSGEVLEDTRIGKVFDYGKKKGIEAAQIFAPKNIKYPDWVLDRETLWNKVEQDPKNKVNSTVAREIVIALPHELTKKQRIQLTSEFSQWLADRYQVVVDMAVHEPSKGGDQKNYHAHIMMTTKQIEENGFKKEKSYTNEKGKSIRHIVFDYGGKRGSNEVTLLREKWEYNANNALARAGSTESIDSRTLEAQGINREPTFHLGYEVTAMERKGFATAVKERFSKIIKKNKYLNMVFDSAKRGVKVAATTQQQLFEKIKQVTQVREEPEFIQELTDKGGGLQR